MRFPSNYVRGAFAACAAACLIVGPALGQVEGERSAAAPESFPVLPLPPEPGGLIGLPQTYTKARSSYLPLITREAERQGIPSALADAVVKVESAFNPNAFGGVGEVGLMQVRPATAAMLGHRGSPASLFDPETNIRMGVAYLARAWQLANGDVCRTLMKYRAGWGEERMTPLSVEYCRRARGHLAALGSPLGAGAIPSTELAAVPFSRVAEGPADAMAASRLNKPRAKERVSLKSPRRPERLRLAALGTVKLTEAQALALRRAREAERMRMEKLRQMWADHSGRLRAIDAKIKPARLNIMSGL